jgi:hypothetical protein
MKGGMAVTVEWNPSNATHATDAPDIVQGLLMSVNAEPISFENIEIRLTFSGRNPK